MPPVLRFWNVVPLTTVGGVDSQMHQSSLRINLPWYRIFVRSLHLTMGQLTCNSPVRYVASYRGNDFHGWYSHPQGETQKWWVHRHFPQAAQPVLATLPAVLKMQDAVAALASKFHYCRGDPKPSVGYGWGLAKPSTSEGKIWNYLPYSSKWWENDQKKCRGNQVWDKNVQFSYDYGRVDTREGTTVWLLAMELGEVSSQKLVIEVRNWMSRCHRKKVYTPSHQEDGTSSIFPVQCQSLQ